MNAMKLKLKLAIPLFVALAYAPAQGWAAPILGDPLASFAILGGGGVTIGGTGSVITGNVGGFPTDSVTGVIPTNFTISGGTVLTGAGTVATRSAAQSELGIAIDALSAMTPTGTPVGGLLGGLTLGPGVYNSLSTMDLTGTLILDGGGNANALWVFQIGSAITTAGSSVVSVINTGAGAGIFWVLETTSGSATLGSGSTFEGNILANVSISVGTTITLGCGRLLTETASVTLAGTDTIGIGCTGTGEYVASNGWSGGGTIENGSVVEAAPSADAPEPATLLLFGFGLAGLFASRKKVIAK